VLAPAQIKIVLGHSDNQTKDLAPHTTGIVPVSYLPYLELYRIRIAFRHGHHVRYGGGVGGIAIPMNKAIA
jgi:hypothetical protein